MGTEQEALRQRELSQILRGVLRIRVVFLPIAAIFLSLIVLYDPEPWKVMGLALVVAIQLLVVISDARRLKRDREYLIKYLRLDLVFMVALQTGVIWLTGAVESPLLVIYIPLGLVTGLVLGPGRDRWLLVGLIVCLIWLMTLLGLAPWGPRTIPSFLDLGPGFADRPIYVLTRAAILSIVVLVGSAVGTVIHQAVIRMLTRAIGARRQVLETLTDRNRELVYLSSAIAHELKNPLASIQGLVQLLDRPTADPQRAASRMEVLRREVGRMRAILDEFLNFSRPLGELTLEPVQIAPLLQEIASLHEGLAHNRGIAIEPRVELDIALTCDPRKIKQALINLLQNALEAAGQGGHVELFARAAGADQVALGIRDSGPGLDPSVVERATEAGVTTKPEGSGIGLAVARAIAEQHGGSLTLRTLPGPRTHEGCEAVLVLPISAREKEADQ